MSKFRRKFFILKREHSNMRHINPKGHGKLELRNNRLKLSINIDNAEGDSYYDIILVGDNQTYDLGKLLTDTKHSGKAEFDLNYKDIESKGFPLEKINGILILRDRDILLGGYIEQDDRSIENYINRLSKTDTKEQREEETYQEEIIEEFVEEEDATTQENRPSVSEEETIEVEDDIYGEIDAEYYPPQVEVEEEVKYIENDLDINNEAYIDDISYEDSSIDEDFISADKAQENRPPVQSVTEEEYGRAMQEIFDESQEFSQEEIDYLAAEEKRKQNQRDQTTNYVLNILRYFPYTEPFRIDLKGYNWWKIDVDDPREDKGFLPYFSYVAGGNHKYPLVQNAVTATELIRKNKHYLFGLYNSNDEVKFYVYGVPGDFTMEEHPQKGTTGFNTWFEGQDFTGYWLLYIEPSTGRVIYPINPMIPKD